jgi:hypothetical protein
MGASIAGLAQMNESKAVAMSDGALDEFFPHYYFLARKANRLQELMALA